MTRTLTLADDAYEELASLKREGESFSDVTRRLVREYRRALLQGFGGSLQIRAQEAEAMKARIRKWRDASDRPNPGGS